jgi:hypothetical protein
MQTKLTDFDDAQYMTDGGVSGTKLCTECGADIGAQASDLCDDCSDPTFDAEAEAVTDAWEGVFISCSWGYNQTQVDFAQITKVSDSGKTVLARLVAGERVAAERGSESVRPAADQYGDEFRLHVRSNYRDDAPTFRGSYPHATGDADDDTRLDTFTPWDNTPGKLVHQTPPNQGH